MSSRPARRCTGGLVRRVVALTALALVIAGCNTRTPERWQIPDGYVGWVVAQYKNPSCTPLPRSDGYILLRIPSSGRLCTSDTQPDGEAFDKYEYVKADGASQEIDQRTMVWGGMASSTGRSFVFLGSEQQLRSSSTSAERLDTLCTTDLQC